MNNLMGEMVAVKDNSGKVVNFGEITRVAEAFRIVEVKNQFGSWLYRAENVYRYTLESVMEEK